MANQQPLQAAVPVEISGRVSSPPILKNNFPKVILGAGTILNVGDPRNLTQDHSIQVTSPNPDIEVEELAEIRASSGNGGLLATAGVTALADGPELGPADLVVLSILTYITIRPARPRDWPLQAFHDHRRSDARFVHDLLPRSPRRTLVRRERRTVAFHADS